MLKVDFKVIPHNEHRYETVGDWWFNFDEMSGNIISLSIRVSDMDNPKYEFLVKQHEEIEAMLCLDRNISEEDVSVFDKMYEQRREKGDSDFQGECGDHPLAPYRKEHFFATTQERAMAAELNVDWSEYDKAVMEL